MLELAAALAAFLALHVIPARPAVRARLAALAGERAYLALYAAASLALLAWVIAAAGRAPYVALWPTGPALHLVPLLVMPLALFLLAGAVVSPPRLSIPLRPAARREAGEARLRLAAITRQPVLWAFALWALAHIPPNGALVPVVLFGLFGVFALAGGALYDRKRRARADAAGRREAERSSFLPFAALITGRARWDWPAGEVALAALLALALYAGLIALHPLLFGVSPLAAFG